MLFQTASIVAVLAFAAQAVAEPKPYMMMSTRELTSLARRDNTTAYQPTQQFCSIGNTCAEACGAGMEMCTSTDSSIHCFNQGAGQICCPGGSGNSCDPGYYCAGGSGSDIVCCPDGTSVTDCAAKHGLAGALTSLAPFTTTTTTTTTTASSTISVANTTVSTTTSCTTTIGASVTYPSSNTTKTTSVKPVVPTSSPTQVGISGASVAGPAAAVIAVAFAAFATLL